MVLELDGSYQKPFLSPVPAWFVARTWCPAALGWPAVYYCPWTSSSITGPDYVCQYSGTKCVAALVCWQGDTRTTPWAPQGLSPRLWHRFTKSMDSRRTLYPTLGLHMAVSLSCPTVTTGEVIVLHSNYSLDLGQPSQRPVERGLRGEPQLVVPDVQRFRKFWCMPEVPVDPVQVSPLVVWSAVRAPCHPLYSGPYSLSSPTRHTWRDALPLDQGFP